MKLLADENIGVAVVVFLRELGYNVVSIIETSPGASDAEVLRRAYRDRRILVTSDTDFGELVYRQKKAHAGVILLRLSDETNANKIRVLEMVFSSYVQHLKGNFVVATETKVRIRETKTTN